MARVVIVTGTPGTGKSTVALRLARKAGWKYVDVNKVILTHKLSEGYDRKKKCKIIDVKKLNRVLSSMIKKSDDGIVIDSHLSHYLSNLIVDTCIVTRCNLWLLKRRLKRRKYSENKIKENLECEIMDVCLIEAEESGHHTIIVETDKKVDYEKLIRKLEKVKKKRN